MRTTRLLAIGAVAALAAGALAACGDDENKGDASGKIEVTATDTDCKVSKTEAAAGTVRFAVTNKGAKVTEFYVYAAGDRVMSEVENIVPGLSREMIVELPAGTYETACKPGMSGKGIRGAFKVTGESKPLTEDAKLAAAAENYQRYVKSQTEVLIVKTKEFVDAVKAGDKEKAKALFPVARTYWERIEPVAEIFGDLDPLIDGREADLEAGTEFTGFHKLEKDLWVTNDVSQSGPIADKLLADVQKIVDLANSEKLSPLQLANGAKELLDEVASGKITGEEDIFSHTDLWDFRANLEGSKAAVAALRPVLDDRDPALATTLDEKFAAAEAALDKHRKGEGWKLYPELTEADLKELTDTINALGEPISKVAAVVAQK
ncbi:iron uptake system protein EfeO [Virgisporangium aurantiacum]|uniref:Lipoprotein n=1 Tax=Virgisporangium aurantiacum TaxID=175570 RepID=A0A8J3Z0I9_9ACTN|nr:iron uptake system protein EfeO [Virgisporangium aurantiacum]GIJ53000.1 lipoprotein [Virgisporangium aurantiacum]